MVVLVRLMLTCFIIRAAPAKKLCPNISASWWEQKPYIYSNQNKPSGALINIFKQSADLCCTNQVHIDWSNKLPSYKAALNTVDAPPPNNSSTSGNVPVWVPFSLLHIAEGSKKMQKELFVTYQIIVFTEVDTRDKLQNLYRGFKRIFSFIMITLLITILFGFFIWLAVSWCSISHVIFFYLISSLLFMHPSNLVWQPKWSIHWDWLSLIAICLGTLREAVFLNHLISEILLELLRMQFY